MKRVLAAADIGSNTAHLLVAEVSGRTVKRIVNDSEWLSLGEVVTRHGEIPSAQSDQLVEVLRGFKRQAEAAKAEKLYVFATEAMRRASNCQDLVSRVEKETGVTIHLISPAKEAELGLRGALLDTRPLNPHLMVEAGGGSVQAAWCRGHEVLQDVSLKVGTGVLMASSGLQHPAKASQVDHMRLMIHQALEEGLAGYAMPRSMVTCGGVARGIWRALHSDGDRVLHLKEISYLAWAVSRLPVETVAQRFGVKPKRAATLLPGALIYEAVLTRFGLEECEVSQYGVREGALLEISSQGGVS